MYSNSRNINWAYIVVTISVIVELCFSLFINSLKLKYTFENISLLVF